MSATELKAFTSSAAGQDGEFQLSDLSDPIPEGLPEPMTFRVFLMPVGMKKEIKVRGGKTLYLPDETIDANAWLHGIARVAALGPACFKHPRYKELGLTEEDFPKVGDLVVHSARSPRRFTFRNTQILIVNDDHLDGRIHDDETCGFYKFYV